MIGMIRTLIDVSKLIPKWRQPDFDLPQYSIFLCAYHEFFRAIGFYYRDFQQFSDEEVIETLGRFLAKPEQTKTPLTAT